MRTKLLTLAIVAGFLISAVPAIAQDDTSGYTSTTPTVTTPTTPKTTSTNSVSPSEDSGSAPSSSSGSSPTQLAHTGSDTWILLAIGGALALGSAALLARERLPRRNR